MFISHIAKKVPLRFCKFAHSSTNKAPSTRKIRCNTCIYAIKIFCFHNQIDY